MSRIWAMAIQHRFFRGFPQIHGICVVHLFCRIGFMSSFGGVTKMVVSVV